MSVAEESFIQKKVAHYSLQYAKDLISDGQYFVTRTARVDYTNLGLDDEQVLEIIMSLVNRDLYKSMTSYSDNKIWQDVYHKTIDNLELYIKLQITNKAIVISFKERT
ncbi:type II toxin-antitoxin system MqsR family toxin [Sulfurimonas sp.]|uniref:type II toxin-antitoxin system MqsR family toxin n=1 Tax=Sulfurimonas sp. TaxID=2022749 RepID=UPI0025D70D3E|nr:type II toxin-antitoxin system MqsR family toxin [Sulfurimonas sp.]